MSISRKNRPVHPLHRKWTWKDELLDFWLTNKILIGIIIVLTCICILAYIMGLAAGTGHLHMFSTEQNRYEHLNQIVCYINGGRFL